MSRRVILWAVVAALLLPTLCETTRFADDDDLQVTEAAPDASADQQPRKTRKRTKPATRTKRTTKSEVPAGIHVTYKNADGDDKDLDDDLRLHLQDSAHHPFRLLLLTPTVELRKNLFGVIFQLIRQFAHFLCLSSSSSLSLKCCTVKPLTKPASIDFSLKYLIIA